MKPLLFCWKSGQQAKYHLGCNANSNTESTRNNNQIAVKPGLRLTKYALQLNHWITLLLLCEHFKGFDNKKYLFTFNLVITKIVYNYIIAKNHHLYEQQA